MIWLALGLGYLLLIAPIIGICIVASDADDRQQAADEHAEWLGIGGAVSFHVDGDAR